MTRLMPIPTQKSFPLFELRAEKLTQKFNRRRVWQDVSLTVKNGETLGITGNNGSGKTTLLRALVGLLTPTGGVITCIVNGKTIGNDDIMRHIGFVAPYLMLYEEFTPLELMRLLAQMRGDTFSLPRADELLEQFQLTERRNEAMRSFSSGMKQRCKYLCALQHNPPLLVLDEPMTNLDSAGIETVERAIKAHQTLYGAMLIATNDARDLRLCSATLAVTDFA
jgi:heme exporter protein A